MRDRIAVIYNEPVASRYDLRGETAAVAGVLESVTAVIRALSGLGYDIKMVPLAPPPEAALEKLRELEAALVFNLFEGFPGQPETEADIADLLAGLAIPFTGSSGGTLRLALDKAETSRVLRMTGVSIPDFQLLTPETLADFRLEYPCIVKPVAEDASHGLSGKSVVYNLASLTEQVNEISRAYGGRALAQEFVGGREFNVTVMGNKECVVLPVSEIVYSLAPGEPRILTFAAKWQPESPCYRGTKVVCPASIEPERQQRIRSVALQTYRRLGLRGYGRVDMRQDRRGHFRVIDVNPNPDISPGAGAARQAAAAGMDYNHFIGKIVRLALERNGDGYRDSADERRRQAGIEGYTAGHARV